MGCQHAELACRSAIGDISEWRWAGTLTESAKKHVAFEDYIAFSSKFEVSGEPLSRTRRTVAFISGGFAFRAVSYENSMELGDSGDNNRLRWDFELEEGLDSRVCWYSATRKTGSNG